MSRRHTLDSSASSQDEHRLDYGSWKSLHTVPDRICP